MFVSIWACVLRTLPCRTLCIVISTRTQEHIMLLEHLLNRVSILIEWLWAFCYESLLTEIMGHLSWLILFLTDIWQLHLSHVTGQHTLLLNMICNEFFSILQHLFSFLLMHYWHIIVIGDWYYIHYHLTSSRGSLRIISF